MAKTPETEDGQPAESASHSTGGTGKIINIQPQHRPWVYSAAAVFVLLVVFAMGASLANDHRGDISKSGFVTAGVAGPGKEFSTRMGSGHHFMTNGGYGTSTNGQSRIMGVVTNVSGSGFTVAGNGSTNQVTTTSSTQYQNGNQVKQNDTVIIFGTSSSGTVIAANIVINP